MRAAHVFFEGRVQGVSFRAYVQNLATELGIHGWVRNLSDGRVEAWFEGSKDNIDNILEALEEGPPVAKIENVEVEWEEPEGFSDFEILITN